MSVALQIRDVSEEDRDVLAGLAAAKGQSLQAFLHEMVRERVRFARNIDLFDRTADIRIDVEATGFDVVAIIREGRDGGFEIDRDEYHR